MAGRDNIVQILRTDHFEYRNWVSERDIPELIHSAKRIARKELQALLQKMFDNVDDCLFEYADKADSNQTQMLYFDAMREVRRQKESMATIFYREFEERYKQSVCGEPESLNTIDVDTNGASLTLSLVEEDDLELGLAVTNMVSEIQVLYREAISALVQRMDHVLGDIGLTSEHFPLSGNVVCESFSAAIDSLKAEVEIKLIIYKLFDKFVAQQLGRIYNDVNAMFVAAGVLPQIRTRAPVNLDTLRRRENGVAENELLAELQETLLRPDGQATELDPDNVFSVMRQLLDRHRYTGTGAPVNVATTSSAGLPGTAGNLLATGVPGGAITTSPSSVSMGGDVSAGDTVGGTYVMQDVLSGLTGLQQNFDLSGQLHVQPLQDGQSQSSGELIKTVLVQELNKHSEDGHGKAIDSVESDAIDIVSMLFDFILGDKKLPDRLKALIARLQIPMVKVAVLDNTFFGQKAHPARQLLNELAYAGTANEEPEDSLYEVIESIVNRILSEFESNVSLFEELLAEFLDYQAKEYESNRLAEEMLEKAKETVAREIEHRIRNNKVPDMLCRLLLEQWKDVMTVIAVRDGAEGDAWDAAIHLMDDLIWSVQPKLVVQEKSQLTRLIPRILNGLQEGLTLIGFAQNNIHAVFAQLEQLHHESLRGLCEVGLKLKSDVEYNVVEEIVLQDPAQGEDFVYSPVQPDLMKSEFYYLVKGMEPGTWLEFISKDRIQRGKLAWKCEFTNDYTFVDRRYKLVADISMAELIQHMEQGDIKMVEDVPLFDRAIDAVVKGMKQCLSPSEEQQGGPVATS